MSTDFKTIYLEKNLGLGNALRESLKSCSYELVARMDSDDISEPRRFELQLEQFQLFPETDIVGGNITEFVEDPANITGYRVVQEDDASIKADMKKRCAMNHVSVMYKKEAVQKAGGYIDWPWNEDYYLWIRMMESGCIFRNVLKPLVNVRTGAEMSARRGGWKYFKSEQGIQKYMYQHKHISSLRYIYNVLIRFGGEVVATNWIRTKLFSLVRENYVKEENPTGDNGTDRSECCKQYPGFSVAMSVYKNDNPEWFDIAMKSLIEQTVAPSEIVLVVDGPIPDSLQEVIDKYKILCEQDAN